MHAAASWRGPRHGVSLTIILGAATSWSFFGHLPACHRRRARWTWCRRTCGGCTGCAWAALAVGFSPHPFFYLFYLFNHHPLSCFLQAGKLDVVLTYLWRVHGVDYYGGAEVAEPDEDQRAGPRPTLRCPRPEEGEQPAEGAEKEQVPRLSLARALPVRTLLCGSCKPSTNICVLCSTAALLTALPAPR